MGGCDGNATVRRAAGLDLIANSSAAFSGVSDRFQRGAASQLEAEFALTCLERLRNTANVAAAPKLEVKTTVRRVCGIFPVLLPSSTSIESPQSALIELASTFESLLPRSQGLHLSLLFTSNGNCVFVLFASDSLASAAVIDFHTQIERSMPNMDGLSRPLSPMENHDLDRWFFFLVPCMNIQLCFFSNGVFRLDLFTRLNFRRQ